MRKTAMLLTAAAVVALPAVAAQASWSTTSAGAGTASATSLGTPSSPSAGSATTSSLTLSWTSPAGLAPGGYKITRNGTDIAGTGGCAATVSGTSCTDSGLSSNTQYTYTVRAVKSAWTGSATAGFTGRTLSLPGLSFTSSGASCASGSVNLGSNGGTWSTKVSIPGAVTANVTITFTPTGQSTDVTVVAGNTESSLGGSGSPNNSGTAKFTLGRADANYTVTASATGYASASCSLTHN